MLSRNTYRNTIRVHGTWILSPGGGGGEVTVLLVHMGLFLEGCCTVLFSTFSGRGLFYNYSHTDSHVHLLAKCISVKLSAFHLKWRGFIASTCYRGKNHWLCDQADPICILVPPLTNFVMRVNYLFSEPVFHLQCGIIISALQECYEG